MKTTQDVHLDGVIFRITQDTGETPEHYAMLKAEAWARKEYYLSQASVFLQQSQNERKKAEERVNILFALREYNRKKRRDATVGIVRKVSRMERMEHYDERKLEQERSQLLARVNEFHQISDNFADLARRQDELIATYDEEIRKLST